MSGAGALLALLAIGCEPAEDGDTRPAAPTRAQADPRVATPLPDAPWFALPDDWEAQHPRLSPNAKPEIHWQMLAEQQVPANPADGAGRAWVEAIHPMDGAGPAQGARPAAATTRPRAGNAHGLPLVHASSLQRIEIGFEVGALGIAEGGLIFVEAEPFWFWSEAQTANRDARGYTTMRLSSDARDAAAVTLVPIGSRAHFRVEGRALLAGERLSIVYGAGPAGARVDRYAERGAEILIAVDADGDGTRRWIEESARLDVTARPATDLVAHGAAQRAPGERVSLSVALVDGVGNLAVWPPGTIDEAGRVRAPIEVRTLDASTTRLVSPPADAVATGPTSGGRVELELGAVEREGTLRVELIGRGPLAGFGTTVHPIVVRHTGDRLYWADLHGHTQLSDGTGTPDDYFAYARDVARLDVVALTDHDHWGPRPLAQRPERIETIREAGARFHAPGRFVTIPGYEWTSWLHGHRHVLYFAGEAPIFSALDPVTDRPDELWDALRGRRALTFAHHPAGEPIATNWLFPPDPELEPLIEIASIHGMSEAADAPVPIRGGVPGAFAREILLRGARLGFVGSGDSHDGHPGLAQLATGQSGLAGLFATSLDRPALLDAMRRRRTFATNGIRPWLSVSIDETRMGGELAPGAAHHRLRIEYEATAPIERIDLVRSGRIARLAGEGRLQLALERDIPALAVGEFHYVRILQEDGGVAWSSPIFVR